MRNAKPLCAPPVVQNASMRTLPRHIGVEEATARLRRPSGWARLMLRRARPCVRMELVWVPSFLFTFHMALPRHPGETTVAVDACSGAFAIFQMHEDLVDAPPEGGEVLGAALNAEEAERLGRDKLLQAILRAAREQGDPSRNRERPSTPRPSTRPSGSTTTGAAPTASTCVCSTRARARRAATSPRPACSTPLPAPGPTRKRAGSPKTTRAPAHFLGWGN